MLQNFSYCLSKAYEADPIKEFEVEIFSNF